MQRYNVTADGGGEGKSLRSKFEIMHQPKFFEIFAMSPQVPLIAIPSLRFLLKFFILKVRYLKGFKTLSSNDSNERSEKDCDMFLFLDFLYL